MTGDKILNTVEILELKKQKTKLLIEIKKMINDKNTVLYPKYRKDFNTALELLNHIDTLIRVQSMYK
jgi:DUF438 domain-containing protein